MKHKTLLLSLSTLAATLALAGGSGAATMQTPSSRGGDDDAHKAALFHALTQGPTADSSVCARQAWVARKADMREAREDFFEKLAFCVNMSDPDEQWECVLEAFDEYDEAVEEAHAVFHARHDLCMLIGDDFYDPEIDPEDFVDGVDNPFFVLTPGVTLVYEKVTDEETEIIRVTTTDETREIMGVECTVVRDTAEVDDEVVEDTFDYFAQDEDGNVWYFGEMSFELEDGYIVSMEGSWIAGEDGALPGIIMPAAPQVGDVYRQEFYLFEAEDAASVLSLNESVDVPFGNYTGCVQTLDFTPIEPGHGEHKYYAPGIGVVLEVEPETGERLELVDIVVDGD